MKILVKDGNVGHKLTVWPKIEILVQNLKFGK